MSTDNIIWRLRFPRILLGAAVGAGLALASVVMQASVQNTLAEPYILGISSGASFGATLAIMCGAGSIALVDGVGSVSFFSFLGSIGAVFMLWTDAAARTLIVNSEVPIGILTALIGAPFFVYIMVARNYSFKGN
ncbi:MAG: iron chelate uptake ABC transporter family permease subunit [Coriobacteriaceae bacterium]|nr:iron chelate uptake ABC transporter family permease subunit [Coriobacteriaceae bacterium]